MSKVTCKTKVGFAGTAFFVRQWFANIRARRTQRPGIEPSTNATLTVESLESRVMLQGAGIVSGSVFLDADADAIRDAAETGIPGVVIYLSDADSSTDRSTITDDDGIFRFDQLDAGVYDISKRQSSATLDGPDSTSLPGAVSNVNRISNIVLAADQNLSGIHFGERNMRPEFINIGWFFASSPPAHQMLRQTVALGEDLAGNTELAEAIRAGGDDVPDDPNRTPIAVDDVFAVSENGVLDIDAALGVLANDTDADGDSLTAALVSQAGNGLVTLDNDGAFVYTPNAGFNGTDTFIYQASDGITTSNAATVTINVNRTNRPPVAADDVYSAELGDVLSIAADSGVLANDSDADGDSLAATLVTQASNGIVSLRDDGSFTYSPNAGFVGIDSFTYVARDGEANSGVATVRIEVDVSQQAAPDFTLVDVNPLSNSEGEEITPRGYLGQVSGWYFGHST